MSKASLRNASPVSDCMVVPNTFDLLMLALSKTVPGLIFGVYLTRRTKINEKEENAVFFSF